MTIPPSPPRHRPWQDRAETQKLTDLKDLEKSKANADIEIVAQQETATAKARASGLSRRQARRNVKMLQA